MSRNRVRAFTGPDAEQRAERCGHWLKAFMGNQVSQRWCRDHAVTKAQGENFNTIGGVLAPVDMDAAIIAVRDTVGAFRNAEVRRARSDSQVRPRRAGGMTANFVVENAVIPQSQLQFDAVEIALRKLAALGVGSAELFEDSEPDLAEFIAAEMGYAFAAAEDDWGFNGDGTSVYVGISGLGTKLAGTKSSIAAASGHSTFLTIDSTDIANLMAGVLATGIPGAHWYVSAIGYAQTLCRLAAVSGGLTATKRPDGTIDASFLGFPVSFSAKLPNITTSLAAKPMMFFGDLKKSSVLVERNERMNFMLSTERYADTDQVAVRGTVREDIINHSCGDASNYAQIAMLVGTA